MKFLFIFFALVVGVFVALSNGIIIPPDCAPGMSCPWGMKCVNLVCVEIPPVTGFPNYPGLVNRNFCEDCPEGWHCKGFDCIPPKV